MNNTYLPGTSNTRACGHIPAGARAVWTRLAALLSSITLFATLTGCSFLKPAQSTARHFVLTPMLAAGQAPAGSGFVAVGVGQVKLPAYLFNTSLAVRKGTNEVEYLPSTIWAERLDTGFQRVLVANLAVLLPADRVYLSAWQRDDVAAEVYVAIEQFDVDATGRGVLIARWRVLSPGGEKVLKAGSSRLSRQGAMPEADSARAIATLSELVADFSRQLAQALQETTSPRQAAVAPGQPARILTKVDAGAGRRSRGWLQEHP